MNFMKTAVLLAGLTALFMAVGYVLGGQSGMVIAFVIAAGLNFWSYWRSDRALLNMYNAQEVDPNQAPDLHRMTAELAQRAGVPMPRLYVVQDDQPNAFATGRNPENAAVAVNSGLLNILSREEAAGVIAHELAHIRNRDTLIMTITATIAGAISFLGQFAAFAPRGRQQGGGMNPLISLALIILAPIAAMVVQMMISRTREYAADRFAGEITGNPQFLASALVKLSNGAAQIPNEAAEMNPATAHLFIVNPLSGARMDGLFSTHPNPQNRIDALMQLAAEMGVGHGGQQGGYGSPASFSGGPWS